MKKNTRSSISQLEWAVLFIFHLPAFITEYFGRGFRQPKSLDEAAITRIARFYGTSVGLNTDSRNWRTEKSGKHRQGQSVSAVGATNREDDMAEMNGAFDPETIAILRAAFDDACASLPSEQHTQSKRSTLARRILTLAAEGERDPVRLRTFALMEIAPPTMGSKTEASQARR